MSTEPDFEAIGLFEARYVAFLETITHLHPRLHRYCARMTGSVLDSEDVMQEAVFEAYRKLDRFDDSRPLSPWLFRIAHNRCIDFLRRREVREGAEAAAVEPRPGSARRALGRALERLVINLPPKERACVLLKDVFDYSLEEIAQLVDSVALDDGRGADYVNAVYPAVHGRPIDLGQRSELIGVLDKAGLDGARLLDQVKSAPYVVRLEECTTAAAQRGVFGSPTMFVGGEMFFGNDRLDFMAEALRSAG